MSGFAEKERFFSPVRKGYHRDHTTPTIYRLKTFCTSSCGRVLNRKSDMWTSDQKLSVQPGYLLVERPQGYKVVWRKQPAELRKIADACKEAGLRKVLVLGPRTKVKLSFLEIHDLGCEIAKLRLKIAVVEFHDASSEDVEFFANVVTNRGDPIQFFDNEQDAKDWLDIP